jgi:elongation factor Ts
MHVAAASPAHVSKDEIPEEKVAAERRVFEEKAKEEGKPDNIVEKIVDGQVAKWAKDIVLLEQEHVNTDKHDSKTIEQLREELAAKVGENVVISRFSCFRIGE